MRNLVDEISLRVAQLQDAILEFDWRGDVALGAYAVLLALFVCWWLWLSALKRANRLHRNGRRVRRG